MIKTIIERTLRVPVDPGSPGDSMTATMQLDATLLKSGFKLSSGLFHVLSQTKDISSTSADILGAVAELLGDHVKHNVYFKDFPDGVPNTFEFWASCIADALGSPEVAEAVQLQLSCGFINLLDLPKYGRYQHDYEDMVAVHEAFLGAADKIHVLHLGGTLQEECQRLLDSLASSVVPISESDRGLLEQVLLICDSVPAAIPMRENRAIINSVRLEQGKPVFIDTPTDVLRLAAYLSDGDVTLAASSKFKSIKRSYRRLILESLDALIATSPAKLGDVNHYSETWKRLAERLHPGEYPKLLSAKRVFDVARGDEIVRSLASRIELEISKGNLTRVVNLMRTAPGIFFRNINRLVSMGVDVSKDIRECSKDVPARILLNLLDYTYSRSAKKDGTYRIFTNTKGKTWVKPDTRKPLDTKIVSDITEAVKMELVSRLPDLSTLVVDPDVLGVAVPTSEKNTESGFSVMPRGSKLPVNKNTLRFFAYWLENQHLTDYDLSVLFMDSNFMTTGQSSWTNLSGRGYTHSGDITSAPEGASEFIDIRLDEVAADYIVPQLNVYCGEPFNEVAEAFFGFMERDPVNEGLPFEPATVKFKSDLRGVGNVALPLVFTKEQGRWYAIWMQMYLKGHPRFNRVETNKLNASMLAKATVLRDYIRIADLVSIMRYRAKDVLHSTDGLTEPVTYIGFSAPDNLPEGSTCYTLSNLTELIGLFE